MRFGTPTCFLIQSFKRLECPEEDHATSWGTLSMILMHFEDGKFFKERDGEMRNNLLMSYGDKNTV